MTRRLLAVVALFLLATAALAAPAQVTLTVSGMHCSGCAEGIMAMLKRTDGVSSAEVSYESKEAVVAYDAEKTSPEKIIAAIEKMGYKAAVKKS